MVTDRLDINISLFFNCYRTGYVAFKGAGAHVTYEVRKGRHERYLG